MTLDERIAACEAIDGGRNREAYETKAAHALRLLPALIARDRARGEVVDAAEALARLDNEGHRIEPADLAELFAALSRARLAEIEQLAAIRARAERLSRFIDASSVTGMRTAIRRRACLRCYLPESAKAYGLAAWTNRLTAWLTGRS